MYNNKAIFAIMIFVVAISGCAKDHASTSKCGDCLVVSFKAELVPIFTQSCATAGCHTGNFPQGNVDLDSASAYAQLMKPGTGYVHAGSPSTSIMLQQLYPEGIPHMPQGGQLSDCDIQKISCWIQQGAANN